MKVVSFKHTDEKYFSLARNIRKIVFIEGMNVSESDEFEFDEEATHYLLFNENNEAVATSRWRETEEGIKLERFAVLKDYRAKGLGRVILKYMLEDVIKLDKHVYLYAQIEAVNFYQKNGFTARGDQFMEAGIKHVLMEYIYN